MRHPLWPRRLRTGAAALAAAVATAALTVVPVGPAAAADNGEWAVVPTPPTNAGPTPRLYFFLESPAGRTLADSVRVINRTDTERTFTVYGADAYNTARDGGFALRRSDEKQSDIGVWTAVGAGTVVIPPKAQADIPFVITVPTNASPGDHVGGIVAMESVPGGRSESNGVAIAVQRAVGARIYLRVAGPEVPGLNLADPDLTHPTPWLPTPVDGALEYTLANTGNLRLAPAVTVTASGLFGHRIRQRGATPQLDLVPGAEARMRAPLTGLWPVDVVTATVTAKADGGVLAVRTTRTVVVSWTGLAVLAALIAAGVVAWRRRRRALVARPRGVRHDRAHAEVG
ncbi:WxL protein peptidoglycan domain-containing protein [Micromonospora sp. KLBMP9576]|uniref:WxL protein peptidoglycan domain-containing protein n=1 Tax=Micromonospora sp. KLBMP9576 TaxID=3424769 RepID=UPI003D8D889A